MEYIYAHEGNAPLGRSPTLPRHPLRGPLHSQGNLPHPLQSLPQDSPKLPHPCIVQCAWATKELMKQATDNQLLNPISGYIVNNQRTF